MHPNKTKKQEASADVAVYTNPVADAVGRTLPRALIDARAAALHPLNCLDIPKATKRVLHATLAFYNLQTKDAIFPARETLALEAGDIAISTLRAHLAILEKKGYIVRLPQRHKPRTAGADWGKFSVVPIRLTQKALILVGLEKVFHNLTSPESSDGNKDKERTKGKNQSSSKNTIPAETAEKRENQIDRETRLPKDLLPLLKRGMTAPQVFKLMGMASKRGQKLSMIYACRARRIDDLGLVGHDLMAYFTSLIEENVDWGWLGKQAQETTAQQAVEARAREFMERLDHRYNGYTVQMNGEDVGIFRVSADHAGEAWIESTCGSWTKPMNLRLALKLLQGDCRMIQPQAYR